MSDRMVDVRVVQSKSIAKTISEIRKVNPESMAEIKRKIEAHEPVFERSYYEVSDIKAVLRLYKKLTALGDTCELYESDEKTTVALMNNLANMHAEIDLYYENHPDRD